ncbi:MAG: aspartate 1-decarboxylase [Planctomycetota bacterium]
MLRELCRAKIHRATVTDANLEYEGSITIDVGLMKEADMAEYEKVLVVNLMNGRRCETYAIAGPAGSGTVCMNGAAARWALPGDLVIIMAFALVSDDEVRKGWRPKIVYVDEKNRLKVKS